MELTTKTRPASVPGIMEENELIDEIKARYNRDYLRMVNDQGIISGKNNWDIVFRTFALGKLAELELRIQKLELINKAS